MKQWFIGIVFVLAGGGVLAVWVVDARSRVGVGVDAWLEPSVVAGQLLAIGSWLALLALGGAMFWRAAGFTALFRAGATLRTRAHPAVVGGYVLATVGFTTAAVGIAFGSFWGDGDAPLVLAALGPALLVFWLLVSVCGLAGRLWWPAIEADAEWLVVSGFFERTTFRRSQAKVIADNGGTAVLGNPYRRERSPLSVLLRYRGSTVMLPTIRLNPRARAALAEPGAVPSSLADPRIVVPPR